MSDDFLVTQGSGTTIRAVEKSSKKAQVVVLDIGGAGAESLLTTTLPVSAASLPLPTGAATSALQGGGLPAALGAGGGLKVDGSGTALPVSLASVPSHEVTNAGTFAVQEASASAIKTAVEVIDNAISGSEMQVDVVAALPAGTNNIGDVDVLSIANGSINGPGVPTIDSYTQVAISAVTGANQSLIAAPGANKQIWVYGIAISNTTAGTVAFQDEDDTALTGAFAFADKGGMAIPPSGNFAMPLFKVATNKALEADVTTGTINGFITYGVASV
jgi:hypothetical protein